MLTNATNLEERRYRRDALITSEPQNLDEHRDSLGEMIPQRDAQSQHEVMVMHTYSVKYTLKIKWRLGGQGNKEV